MCFKVYLLTNNYIFVRKDKVSCKAGNFLRCMGQLSKSHENNLLSLTINGIIAFSVFLTWLSKFVEKSFSFLLHYKKFSWKCNKNVFISCWIYLIPFFNDIFRTLLTWFNVFLSYIEMVFKSTTIMKHEFLNKENTRIILFNRSYSW